MLTLRLRILSEGKRQSPRRPNPEGGNVAFSWRTRHSDDNDGLKSINLHQQRSINSKASFEKQRLNHLKCEPHPPTVPGSGQRVLALTQRSIQQDFPVHRHEFIPRNDATCRRTRRSVSWSAARGIASLYEVAGGQSDTTCRNGDSVNNYIIPSLLLFCFVLPQQHCQVVCCRSCPSPGLTVLNRFLIYTERNLYFWSARKKHCLFASTIIKLRRSGSC